MSVKIEEKKLATTFKERFAGCIKGPNLIRTLVVIVCVGICVQQLTSCIGKIIDIPITTYTHFEFNKTIMYPSVTFCREPPYKFDKMLEYGLYAHPLFTSSWRHFDFGNTSLDDLWGDITYSEDDFFVMLGLNGSRDNVIVTPRMMFTHGRCFTVSPRVLITQASRANGYSVMLQHTAEDIATSTSVNPPGYHVYVHYSKQPFTEVEVYNGGLIEYLYIHAGEEIDVKLTVDQYVKISHEDEPCTTGSNDSANQCTTRHVWSIVEDEVGCSGPWMTSSLPRCNNYTDMRNLISSYLNNHRKHHHLKCPMFCRTYLYNAFVTNRQDKYCWDASTQTWVLKSSEASLQTQMYIHFNSMMVSIYEERYNYDWNLFVADLGGSIGFLLGLSVRGLMNVFGKLSTALIRNIKSSKINNDDTLSTQSTFRIKGSDNTGINKVDEIDFVKKCKEWNERNDKLIL